MNNTQDIAKENLFAMQEAMKSSVFANLNSADSVMQELTKLRASAMQEAMKSSVFANLNSAASVMQEVTKLRASAMQEAMKSSVFANLNSAASVMQEVTKLRASAMQEAMKSPVFANLNSAASVMQEARKSLELILPTFRDIDVHNIEVSEKDEQVAKAIAQVVIEQESFQKATPSIVLVTQEQNNSAVQIMLWLFLCQLMDWVIGGIISTLISAQYSSMMLDEGPQAAKKAVQESARIAVGPLQFLGDYRYVSATVLIVRQNPKARSPEIGRLSFGKAVKLQKREKDFSLILWVDEESGAEIQGWVFSRYLGKFN